MFWPHDDISPAPTNTTLPEVVAIGVGVRLAVGFAVPVLRGVDVRVAVGFAVPVLSGVGVRVAVGAAVAPPEVWIMSCGALDPDSRLAKLTAVLPEVVSPKL